MPQSGLTSRDRRVRRSRTVGAKTIVSLISFLACLYESFLPPRSESRGGNRRGIEPLRKTQRWEGGEGNKHLDRRGTLSALLGSETRKMAAGRFPGHASPSRRSPSIKCHYHCPLDSCSICASGMRLLGAGLVAEKTSTGAATGPRRKYGCGTAKCSQSRPATVLLATKRYLRIAKAQLFAWIFE